MNALFQNPGNNNNWIKLKLVGTSSNRSAIGARVKITASNTQGQSKIFFNTVNSGGSFGANPLLVEQGLGDFDIINQVEILWPGQAAPQIIKNIKSKSYLLITQGDSKPKDVIVDELNFSGMEHHH